ASAGDITVDKCLVLAGVVGLRITWCARPDRSPRIVDHPRRAAATPHLVHPGVQGREPFDRPDLKPTADLISLPACVLLAHRLGTSPLVAELVADPLITRTVAPPVRACRSSEGIHNG